jgi:muramoyltetrapeptide carboxypeptidase
MDRRTFAKSSFIISGGLLSAKTELNAANSMENKEIRSVYLKPGDRIGVIAPSSRLKQEQIDTAIQQIEGFGMIPVLSKHIAAHNGYLAGTDEERVEDINEMFADKSIKAIWCGRGGYGSTRILHLLDYKTIKKNPKPFIGYSDISAYHIAIFQKTGLITFHGPIPSGIMKGITLEEFQKLFFENKPIFYDFKTMPLVGDTSKYDVLETLRPGVANGKLIGGNLTVVSSMVGMPHAPNFKNSIAFFEDIDEQPYRIDRMLTQLIYGSNLKEAKGILLGQFTSCEAKDPSTSFTLLEALKDRLLPLGIPILAGTPFGHVPNNLTIPVGVEAILDATNQTLKIEQPLFKN